MDTVRATSSRNHTVHQRRIHQTSSRHRAVRQTRAPGSVTGWPYLDDGLRHNCIHKNITLCLISFPLEQEGKVPLASIGAGFGSLLDSASHQRQGRQCCVYPCAMWQSRPDQHYWPVLRQKRQLTESLPLCVNFSVYIVSTKGKSHLWTAS